MDRLAQYASGIVLLTVLASLATGACGNTESGSRGQGVATAGASGSQVGAPNGGSGGGGGSGGSGGGSQSSATAGGLPSTSGAVGLGGGFGGLGMVSSGGNAATAGNSQLSGGQANATTGLGVAGANATGGGASSGSGGAGGQDCSRSVGNYCECMPRFLGTQVVDGAGDEFSAFAPMTFTLRTAPYVNPGRASALPEVVTLRAAWSEQALHVHVHVIDQSIVPDSSASLWNGDNVQLFAAPTGNLTGTYTGTEDGGAIHVLISAPDTAGASRAIVIYQNGVATNSPFVTGLYATRRVTGGYDVEAQLQWLPIADPLQTGGRIGFDLVVGAASDTSSGLALEGGLANNPVTASSPACELGGRIQPGCDDRTWCRPVLQ